MGEEGFSGFEEVETLIHDLDRIGNLGNLCKRQRERFMVETKGREPEHYLEMCRQVPINVLICPGCS